MPKIQNLQLTKVEGGYILFWYGQYSIKSECYSDPNTASVTKQLKQSEGSNNQGTIVFSRVSEITEWLNKNL